MRGVSPAPKHGPQNAVRRHEVERGAQTRELHAHGLRGGVYREREVAVAAVLALEGACGVQDAAEVASRTSRDDALLNVQLAVFHLVEQVQRRPAVAHLLGRDLDLVQDVLEIGVELVDRVDARGVEGERNHGAHLGEVHAHAALVVGDLAGAELTVVGLATVYAQEFAGLVVGHPDGRQAGGLGRHDVDAVAEVAVHARNARAHELHDLVLHVAAAEDRADDGQRDVLRAHAGHGCPFQVDAHDLGALDVVGVAQQLLDELAAALADGHGAQGAVAGV